MLIRFLITHPWISLAIYSVFYHYFQTQAMLALLYIPVVFLVNKLDERDERNERHKRYERNERDERDKEKPDISESPATNETWSLTPKD